MGASFQRFPRNFVTSGFSIQQIARQLDRNPTSIRRELKRCKQGQYDPKQAQLRYLHARTQRCPYKLKPDVIGLVSSWLKSIPMAGGFMYLVAIIDVYSRHIVGWDIFNSMQASWVVKTLQQTISEYGAPEIINSDQGTQFTSEEYIGYIKGLKTVKLSMDGKGRATDNAYIERFFRTIKHDKIYLHLPGDGHELFRLCLEFIEFYNTRRGHSTIQGIPPAQRYMQQAA